MASGIDATSGSRGATIAAREAEREANLRITQARKIQQDAVVDGEKQLDAIKDEYVQRSEAESVRQDATYSSKKSKNNEALRELQTRAEAELARVRRQGESDLARSKSYYADTLYKAERTGDEKIRELQGQQHQAENYTRADGGDDIKALEQNHAVRLTELQQKKNDEMEQLQKDYQVDYDAKKMESDSRSTQAGEHFQENFDRLRDQHFTSLNEVNSKASEQLRSIRQDTAIKLDAYASRQRDPFYKMVEIDADLSENSEAYVLRAEIPAHEREHISATIRGNQLVLSGQRRSEEKLELAPGRAQSTSAYQSYSESFPLALPVDARQLQKAYDGDTLVVTVPKKSSAPRQPYQKKKVERVVAERPQFPGHLPVPLGANGSPLPPDEPTRKSKGSGTIA